MKLKKLKIAGLYYPWELDCTKEVNLSKDAVKGLLHCTVQLLGVVQTRRALNFLFKAGQFQWREQEDTFEVESILDHSHENGVVYYLVKWKGWPSAYNSWVARNDLQCEELIDDYTRIVKSSNKKRKASVLSEAKPIKRRRKIINDLAESLSIVLDGQSNPRDYRDSNGNISNYQLLFDNNNLGSSHSLKSSLRASALHRAAVESGVFKLLPSYKFNSRNFRSQWKEAQIQCLKEWQHKLHEIMGGPEPLILIENDVDEAGPPVDFKFITDYIYANGVPVNDDPLAGCSCRDGDCYDNRSKCCANASGSNFAYTKNGRLRVQPGTAIFECNRRCDCSSDCPNRVVQRGMQHKLCIFRTSDGRGWGVKTLQRILKGTFITEYIGEVISSEEAETRESSMNGEYGTYLFDIDYNSHENKYTIDGRYYSNISHFINHSCEPNLMQYCVWVNNPDINMPRIAFFANRDIRRGEEITFDYKMIGGNEDNEIKRTKCLCKSTNCRGYMT